MKNKTIKVTANVKKYGSMEVSIEEFYAVVAEDENVEEIVQMVYGCWYDIINFDIEPADIIVSPKALKELVTELIDQIK
jgi:uncharacterized membrane-anchored protein YjiN (DUF445 family)